MPFSPSMPRGASHLNQLQAFPEASKPLIEFHEALLRGPSPFSESEREPIAERLAKSGQLPLIAMLKEQWGKTSRPIGFPTRRIILAIAQSIWGCAMKYPSVTTWLAAAMLVATFGFSAAPAIGQNYPSRPIKIIVPTPAGGIGDLLARVLAQKLSEGGKTAIVENRPGGAGVIGADAAAKSVPDGYTAYMGLHQTQSVLPHLVAKLPYDPAKDFLPVIHIATSATILVVHPTIPARTVEELVAYAKANPGRLTYASQGNGSLGHIGGALFKQIAGIDIVHVPYRGAAPAIQDLIAGHVSMMFDIVPLAMPQMAANKVRALAVTSPQRVSVLPNVPTMTEAGLPGVQGGPWFGLLVPAGSPNAAIELLNVEANKAFSAPDIRDPLLAQGLLLPLGTPENFRQHILAETKRWGEIIRKAAIQLQ